MMLRRAVRLWNVKPEWCEALPQVAARMVADPSEDGRKRLRAMELLATLQRDNIATLQVLDKIHRLDTGKSTENVAAVQYIEGVSKGDV